MKIFRVFFLFSAVTSQQPQFQEVLDAVESLSDDYFTRKMNGSVFNDAAPPAIVSPQPPIQSFAPPSQLPSPNGSTTPIPYNPIYEKFEYV